MKPAIGLTLIGVGALAIYSGFRNVPMWDNVLAVVRGKPIDSTPIPSNGTFGISGFLQNVGTASNNVATAVNTSVNSVRPDPVPTRTNPVR